MGDLGCSTRIILPQNNYIQRTASFYEYIQINWPLIILHLSVKFIPHLWTLCDPLNRLWSRKWAHLCPADHAGTRLPARTLNLTLKPLKPFLLLMPALQAQGLLTNTKQLKKIDHSLSLPAACGLCEGMALENRDTQWTNMVMSGMHRHAYRNTERWKWTQTFHCLLHCGLRLPDQTIRSESETHVFWMCAVCTTVVWSRRQGKSSSKLDSQALCKDENVHVVVKVWGDSLSSSQTQSTQLLAH